MAATSVSLVLGSGGARGLAHIGVIQWLENHGFEIRSIAGASMGALVGGIYAAGELDAYTHWVKALEKMDILRLLDFSFNGGGMFRGERIMKALKELIGEHRIEDLPISFTAVATDVEQHREVWLNHGPLFEAIRASISIPTVFTPVSFRGRMLLDGALINPIPIAPTLKDKTDLTVAVDVNARPEPLPRPEPPPVTADDPDRNGYRRLIGEFLDGLQGRLFRRDPDEADFFDVITRSLDVMQSTITRFQLAAYSPDVIVAVPRNVCTIYEFYRAEELIEIGRKRAERALRPHLRAP